MEPGFGNSADSIGMAVPSPSGSILVAATGAGSIDFGGGSLTSTGGTNVFVAELDATGKYVWSNRYGGTMNEASAGLAAITGGLFLTGTSTGTIDFGGGPLASAGTTDVFLAKLRVP